MGEEWNIKLKKKKSQVITTRNDENVAGIKCVKKAKYLGVNIDVDC